MKAFPRDIDVVTLKERHIGVENELSVNNYQQNVSKELHDKLNEKGLLQPSIGFDGGGREFRTNPISVKSILKQKRGRKYLTQYYTYLKEGTTPIASGGTHIHISILDKDHEYMESNAVALATVFYEQFQKIAGRRSDWAYKIQGVTTIQQLRAYCDKHRSVDRNRVYYMKGSMLAPTGHKTLEFRGGRGTNDSSEVLAWIEFLNNVVRVANKGDINGVTFKELLKGTLIEEYVAKLPQGRKLTKKDLDKTVDVDKLA